MNQYFSCFLRCWNIVIKYLSGERLLTCTKRPNGGDIVTLRALLVSSWMTPVAIYLDCLFGNSHQIDIIPTLGTIFAASYFGLYARFASQWSYLANLYNQIKATETVIADGDTKGLRVIAEWKAGFMEDAQDLHLATKKNVVSTILIWGSDKAVSKAFADHTPGGKERFNALIKDVKAAYDLHEKALVKKIGSGTTAAS